MNGHHLKLLKELSKDNKLRGYQLDSLQACQLASLHACQLASLQACQLVGLPAKKYRIINMGIVKFEKIENNIIELRGQKVILDSDVADLYKVETRDVNKS